MRSLICTNAVLLVLVAGFVARDANSQTVATDKYPGLPAVSDVFAPAGGAKCSPAPCVVAPVWPSTSVFTADAPIAVNPLNPHQLLLGSVDQNCPQDPGVGFYLSNDGGSNWQRTCLPQFVYKGSQYVPVNEPLVAYDSNGTAYETAAYVIDDDFSTDSFVAFQKSSDGGITWSAPAPAMHHKDAGPGFSRLAVDANPLSPHANNVYIAAVYIGPPETQAKNQLVVTHSNDGGEHWTQVPLTPLEPNNRRELRNPNITVGRDGTVYLFWLLIDAFDPSGRADVLFSKSTDGGNTWSPASRIATAVLHGLPNALQAVPIDTPPIGVDNSGGPNSGNLYVAMDSWTGTNLRVGVVHSTDGGNTWSRAVPVAPPNEMHDQFFPWLAVSPSGLVAVSWMDRRNDPNNLLYQPFAAFTSDGGQSFGPNILLSEGFSDATRGGEGGEWIGDYTGAAWAGPNYFVAAWMDNSQTPYMEDVVGGVRLK